MNGLGGSTGRSAIVGSGGAPGCTINFPLPPGTTGEMYRRALDDVVVDAARAFAPTWVLVSAGYDAHRMPPWILAIANRRAPFRPYDPAIDGSDEHPPAPPPPPIERRRLRPWALAVGLVVAGTLLVALSIRIRSR